MMRVLSMITAATLFSFAAAAPVTPLWAAWAAQAAVTPPAQSKGTQLETQLKFYEQKFFERTFDGETDARRLDRLDTFIFGSTNTGSPKSRLAMIAKTVQVNAPGIEEGASQSGQSPGQSNNVTSKTSSAANTGTNTGANTGESPTSNLESPGNYPHITALEAKLLGDTYTDQPISQRLSRLETKVFGSPSKNNDLEARTDALDRYMRAKQTPKEMHIGQRLEEDDDGLVGDLTGILPRLPDTYPPGFPNKNAALDKSYESAEEDPGSVVRHLNMEQELSDAQKTTPPTRDERTLSRIAWCEQQIFGKVFPAMHLLKRLHNLNHELFPDEKVPDIELMDRIDTIVKEVVLRKQPHQPVQT